MRILSLLLWLVLISASVLGIYIGYLYFYRINSFKFSKQLLENVKVPNEENVNIRTIDSYKWIEDADKQKEEAKYSFPVNIIDINIDVLRDEDLKIDPTKILLQNLDDVRFYFVNQILNQRKIKYSYYKDKTNLSLLLFVPEEKQRDKLLADFKYFKIDYKMNIKEAKWIK